MLCVDSVANSFWERTVLEYFRRSRSGVEQSIKTILGEHAAFMGHVSPLGADLAARLEKFSSGGKMIRGILVRLGYELFAPPSAKIDEVLDRAGAAMELFQAGLLIHDDIMDRDSVRRGMPTVHEQYKTGFATGDSSHAGMSMGICAGDVAFFLGTAALSSLPAVDSEMAGRMRLAASFTAEELCLVGVAQMQDVLNGDAQGGIEPSEEDILGLYRYKTGRYTFSLPLVVGAILAGADEPGIRALDEAGEYLGLVFQLKDDELGLFADSAALGKVPGSDIKENKKTLHRRILLERASAAEKPALEKLFGKSDLSAADIETVRDAMDASGVTRSVAGKMLHFADLALERFGTIKPVRSEARVAFLELRDYSLSRKA